MTFSSSRWTVRWLVILFCLSNSTFLLAQSTGGRILGRVADPSGAVLAGVKVTLVNEATGVSREAVSSDSGDFVFVEVPVGTIAPNSTWPASRRTSVAACSWN